MPSCKRCSAFISVQELPIQVPVQVRPCVAGGQAQVYVCGAPWVAQAGDGSGGYVLRQQLCLEMPLRIGASATVGDARICPDQQTME